MLDSQLRKLIDPGLNAAGAALVRQGVHADRLTLAGFGFGLCAFAALAFEAYGAALLFILLSRLADGLDGPVARHSQRGATDRGAFFDILSDFIFYAGIVFFFAVGRPETSLAAAFLIFSYIGTATSFLAYSILATKNSLNHERQGKKSFFYTAGLCEGTETIIFMALICLLPDYFSALAVTFGALCWVTTAGRAIYAAHELK